MSQRAAFITGANGAIGQALCSAFCNAGWRVIASDQGKYALFDVDVYIPIDLEQLCCNETYQNEVFAGLREELHNSVLHVLINNAAVQIIAPVEQLSANDWHSTLDVNLIAPFLLIKAFLPELKKANGSVINIASIHAQLSKPHFAAYAASKAALVGMTRSLAVELGRYIRVNAISPAAIATPMLEAGFEGNQQGFTELASCHPSGCVGTTKDVAKAALYLAEAEGGFLNGTVISLDGGIASRLHDPV
ncbi:MAG: SDR family oxidoreductase [Candidatus Polarisedimenticolaceae bacterium]|nr:SDR family oxidoreductase [Candidatus Polarisedimenticolaceae bacterium]